ncbi:MAG: hypothetical protein ACYSSJ_05550 [Planctomycetota bacterium]|jgi:GNAT superfamily N-acetyltransferase
MKSISPCSLQKYLKIFPAKHSDYEHLYRFHYLSAALGPTRAVYKLIDDHPWRRLAAPVVGVIVYGVPSANLAARNAATGGLFAGLDRSAALSLVNEHMVCIRRVIIEPRYRGLGLASRLVAETMPLTGAAMVEAVSVMGRIHPFFERAGMRAFDPRPDAKTERMAAALESVGIGQHSWHDSKAVQTKIEQLDHSLRIFTGSEMDRFCQKFTNRRGMPDSLRRTDFVLSKLTACGAYYLWYANTG